MQNTLLATETKKNFNETFVLSYPGGVFTTSFDDPFLANSFKVCLIKYQPNIEIFDGIFVLPSEERARVFLKKALALQGLK